MAGTPLDLSAGISGSMAARNGASSSPCVQLQSDIMFAPTLRLAVALLTVLRGQASALPHRTEQATFAKGKSGGAGCHYCAQRGMYDVMKTYFK